MRAPPWCPSSLAVHLGGPPCPSARSGGCAGSRVVHPRARPFDRTGDFEDLTTAATVRSFLPIRHARGPSPPPLPCDCFTPTCTATSAPSRVRRPRPVGLSWGCPKIAPPSGSPPESISPPRSPWLSPGFSRRRSGVATALSRLPAQCPTSSFGYDLAGLLLLRLPGSCTRPQSWGSAPFRRPRLSPPSPSRRRAPALRSFPPRWKPPDPLTRAVRRLVTPAPLPTRGSPSPLPPRAWSLPTGTSRPCSSSGAAPPCFVAETDGPLLPWA